MILFNKINFGSLPYLVVLCAMDRRNFLKNTCSVACACAFVGVSTLLQSCEDNIDDDYNTNTGGGTTGDGDQDDDYQLVVDIGSAPHTALQQINGTSSLGSNSIDGLGLLLVRSSSSTIKAFSRSCTHASYSVNSYNIHGEAICSSGHGGSFNLNGGVVNGPPSSSLRSYSTNLDGNLLTITK